YEEYQGLLEDDVTDEELEKDTISDDVFEKGELVEPSFSAPADAIGTNIIQAYPAWKCRSNYLLRLNCNTFV
ncbi:hypothetical protein V7186_19670, partial [Bacillus safensis]